MGKYQGHMNTINAEVWGVAKDGRHDSDDYHSNDKHSDDNHDNARMDSDHGHGTIREKISEKIHRAEERIENGVENEKEKIEDLIKRGEEKMGEEIGQMGEKMGKMEQKMEKKIGQEMGQEMGYVSEKMGLTTVTEGFSHGWGKMVEAVERLGGKDEFKAKLYKPGKEVEKTVVLEEIKVEE
jgi:hypothetical protein